MQGDAFSAQMIREAYARIAPYVVRTPLIRLHGMDGMLGCQVYVKAECMQITGAFKIRGAANMIRSLPPESLDNGIVTASSGNHGRACAYIAAQLGIPATVVIPDTAAAVKVENVRSLGAEVVLCRAEERFAIAHEICSRRHASYIPPYDDWRIMAGQGTAGLEILEQQPDLDTVVVPVSGGGLLSGVAAALKAGKPEMQVIGAEPELLPRYTASLAAGAPVEVPQQKTVADALVSNHPGAHCFPVVRQNVDRIVTVPEDAIRTAQRLLLCEGKLLAEPSSCIGIAGVLSGRIRPKDAEKVCFLISGGNCDLKQIVME